MSKRDSSDERYVLDLVAKAIQSRCSFQHRFDGLLGDPSKTGRRAKLPVEGYFPSHNLIVEYRERQHFEHVPIMDRRMTISGIPRGEQRHLYDRRREQWTIEHGYKLLIISYRELSHKKNGRLAVVYDLFSTKYRQASSTAFLRDCICITQPVCISGYLKCRLSFFALQIICSESKLPGLFSTLPFWGRR